LLEFIRAIAPGKDKLWGNDGRGWLAYRIVRPGYNDGYPLCKKSWGPAKNVISCWIPIVGFDKTSTLLLVPKSHKREYKKYTPVNSKFASEEQYLDEKININDTLRPSLNGGEVIIFHPELLHSEDVIASNSTRINLEIRFY